MHLRYQHRDRHGHLGLDDRLGRLRLEHRQASLEELGALADPPMTKDAVAGRIRRLLATADKRAAELGIPGTDAALAEADIDALEAELHAELEA